MDAGVKLGSRLMTVSTLSAPVRSNASAVMVTMGLADSKSGRAMRQPVTMICSNSWSATCALMVSGSSSCAANAQKRLIGSD